MNSTPYQFVAWSKVLVQCAVIGACLLAVAPIQAQTPEEKGLAIAVETDRRDAGFGDSVATATMTLRDKAGTETIRRLRMLTLEQTQDGDRTLAVFDTPADLAGTTVLTWAHALTPDDQWLYLPSLKRTKRIASSNKAAAFMGSELAFEDLSAWEVKKYNYRWLRDERLDGNECFVIENIPAYKESGYSRQVEWLDRTIYQPRRIDYYNQDGTLFKTMRFSGYKQYLGKHWRPSEQVMENKLTGKSTRLAWSDWRFKTGLSATDFSSESLGRAR